MTDATHTPGHARTALVVGASRALGLALAAELLRRGWDVIGTVRSHGTELHELADRSDGHLVVETLDMTEPDQIAALRDRLADRSLDLLFVNAGTPGDDAGVAEVSSEMFAQVMVTNALSPMRVVEAFRTLVVPDGTIGVMSSRQGSLTVNTTGGHDVYRASKSALNQLMRSYAARRSGDGTTLLLVHPGWVQTDLGGPGAMLTVDQSIPGVVDTLDAYRGRTGLHFVDYQGQVVPW